MWEHCVLPCLVRLRRSEAEENESVRSNQSGAFLFRGKHKEKGNVVEEEEESGNTRRRSKGRPIDGGKEERRSVEFA